MGVSVQVKCGCEEGVSELGVSLSVQVKCGCEQGVSEVGVGLFGKEGREVLASAIL